MAEKEDGQKALERLNRQVNYFVMRYMWQVICGRNADDTIYATFDTSRERFTRIIDTGTVRYGKGELDGLNQITGLRKEIFTGEVRFRCLYFTTHRVRDKKTGNQEEQTVPIEITEDEWKELIQWRKKRKENKEAREKETENRKTPQTAICDKLKKCDRKDVNNWDFYRLCYFLRERKPAPLRIPPSKIREIQQAIQELTFPVLDKCEVAQLQSLLKLLKEKNNLIAGIVAYKNARDKSKEK